MSQNEASEQSVLTSLLNLQYTLRYQGITVEQLLLQSSQPVSDEGVLELLWSEISWRNGMGSPCDFQEAAARFPHLTNSLRRMFDIVEVLRKTDRKTPLPVGGATLGAYALLEEVGRGSGGVVYKARHSRTGRLCALKILSFRDRDIYRIGRFEREIDIVTSIQHPNVIAGLDSGFVDGFHFLAMEYEDGLDLRALVISRGPLPMGHACNIIRQVALGLEAAHQREIIHRDLKPSNIFLTSTDGQAKILDWGLARLLYTERHGTLAQIGTPAFMAPEQFDEPNECDARTDLFALGRTLGFLLLGSVPGPVESSSCNSIFQNVDPAVVSIYRKLVAIRKDDRFNSAGAVARALLPLATENSDCVSWKCSTNVDEAAIDARVQAYSLGSSRRSSGPEM